MACAVCLAGMVAQSMTTEVTLDYVTAYVDRGITGNERGSLQGGIAFSEFDEDLPLTLGIWADWAANSSKKTFARNEWYYCDHRQFGEVDIDVDYELEFGKLTAALGYTAYVFTDADIDTDHEVRLVLSYETFLEPTVGLFYTFAGDPATAKTWYLECGVSHEFDIGDELAWRDRLTLKVGADVGIQWWNGVSKEDYYEYEYDEDEDEEYAVDFVRGLRSGFSYAKYYAEGTWTVSALDDLGIKASLNYFQRMRKDTLGDLHKCRWVAKVGMVKEF